MTLLYGARPLRYFASIAALAFAGYAFYSYLEPRTTDFKFLLWFVGAIVAHDMIAWPLYTGLNNLAYSARRRHDPHEKFVAGLVYLRVPAVISGLVFVIWLPLILDLSEGTYLDVAGKDPDGFLGRWLLLTGLLFLGSGVLFALRTRRATREDSAPG